MYPPNWKTEIVPRILKRDKYTCKRCGATKGQIKFSFSRGREYKVVLCIAHLDHDKENHKVKDSRLLTLCQSCHVNYDNKTDPNRVTKRLTGRNNRRKPKKSEIIKRHERLWYDFKAKHPIQWGIGSCGAIRVRHKGHYTMPGVTCYLFNQRTHWPSVLNTRQTPDPKKLRTLKTQPPNMSALKHHQTPS